MGWLVSCIADSSGARGPAQVPTTAMALLIVALLAFQSCLAQASSSDERRPGLQRRCAAFCTHSQQCS